MDASVDCFSAWLTPATSLTVSGTALRRGPVILTAVAGGPVAADFGARGDPGAVRLAIPAVALVRAGYQSVTGACDVSQVGECRT